MTNKRVFNVNCQAQLGEISQWHQHAPAFCRNMFGHTVAGWHLPQRSRQCVNNAL